MATTTKIQTLFTGKDETAPDFVNVIRTDARFSTQHFQQSLVKLLSSRAQGKCLTVLQSDVRQAVHSAYAQWGTSVVSSLKNASGGNDEQQVDDTEDADAIAYHLHDAQKLSHMVVSNANCFADEGGCEPLLVSLDDIISAIDPDLDEIAFSRLFSMDGKTYSDFVARPGRATLVDQFNALKESIDSRLAATGTCSVPLVLLEDNVRHARMLNWLFDQMKHNGVLDNARVVGISSCFCCASDAERQKIISNDRFVPVTAVVDYHGAKIDVITPRDLMFDGFVVDVEGTSARLPGVFMDVKSRFNVSAECEKQFLTEVIDANVAFCQTIEDTFGESVPMKWFATAPAISHVTKMLPDTRMIDVMHSIREPKLPMLRVVGG